MSRFTRRSLAEQLRRSPAARWRLAAILTATVSLTLALLTLAGHLLSRGWGA